MTTDTKPVAAMPSTEILTGLPDSRRIALTLQQSTTRIVVLTPDPEHAKALKHRFRNTARVQIIAAALAGTGEPAQWVRYNEPGLGAFRAPTPHLRKLFPGLAIRKRLTVERVTCADLAEQLGTDTGPLTLEIDTPGEETQILEALAGSELLAALSEVRLRSSREVLFRGGAALNTLLPTLRRCGYQLVGRDDRDADRPMLRFQPDPIHRELSQMIRLLQADLDDLRARYEVVETTREAQAKLLAKLLPSLEEAVRQLHPPKTPNKGSAESVSGVAPTKKSQVASKPGRANG